MSAFILRQGNGDELARFVAGDQAWNDAGQQAVVWIAKHMAANSLPWFRGTLAEEGGKVVRINANNTIIWTLKYDGGDGTNKETYHVCNGHPEGQACIRHGKKVN